MEFESTGSGEGNSKYFVQDAMVWDVPELGTGLWDGKIELEWTGARQGNINFSVQVVLVWDVPERGTVL